MAEDRDYINEYPLTRDFVDFNRLNLQHNLWRDIFGYVLHPKISHEAANANLKVADVGTGTGNWLLGLTSHFHPSTKFLGLDTDISQAGPPEFLPPNVSLRKWDVFTDVPDDLVDQFDIIHLRLFGFVIQGDPKPVLRNLIKLLKPGGYIQWSEADVESWHVKTINPDIPTTNLTALWRQSVPEGSRLLPTWVKALPQAFEEEGLLDVEADWQEGKPHTTLAMHWCNLHLYPMFASKVRATNPEKAKEIEGLLERAVGESRKGAMFAFNRVNVVGRRAGT